ncbi:MAG: hypothetical protein SF052_25830 [Bacteroidia bacterium]|nr:hypothetical protein [Bacteroidia bacterium]
MGYYHKFLFSAVLFLFSFSEIFAQTYITSAGIRLGNSFGLTVNQRVLNKVTVEGILQNDFNQTTYLHVLARRHKSILARRANVYFGGGPHFGFQNGTGGIAGVDALLGAEVTLAGLNISADFKPHLTSGEGNGFGLNTAVSVRYVFVKDNAIDKWKRNQQQKKKQRERQREKNQGGKKI